MIEKCFLQACKADVENLKPGNVSVDFPGHGMDAQLFLDSAEAAAPKLCAANASLGKRVLEAVQASIAVAGCNTNLGILLLCAPLAMAAAARRRGETLENSLDRVLLGATVQDTEQICHAIAIASPGGLSGAEQYDVRAPVRAQLIKVMRAAAARDRIAGQYASGFGDIFQACLPWWREHMDTELPVTRLYLRIASSWPDSHVARKFGDAQAELIREKLGTVEMRVKACKNARSAAAALAEADAELKRGGVNPGTSADLTVATLYAHCLDTAY